ncbi:MAG: hypothetical protein V1752_08190 [Candidatus Firestonebacteria bacterium]
MKNPNKTSSVPLFKCQPTKDTVIAFVLGIFVIIISFSLLLFSGNATADKISFFILRDFIMIFGLGFVFPLYYVLIVRKENLSEFGITRQKWLISLVIDVVLAMLLLFQFISGSEEAGQTILLSPKAMGPIFYIMVAGIFEVIFFYTFLRQRFENAFGIIPSIILVALFYSFHHAGFQPEYLKLFFVGIMYASILKITKNALIIYPFFWGVGASWDVLVSFGAIKELEGAWIKGLITLILMMTFAIYLKFKMQKIKNN